VRKRERREQRRFTAHLRHRRRYWFAAAGAVLALMLFVAVGVLSPLTAVREVRIAGASQVNVEDLQTALARFEGVPLALVSEQDVHRALEPFPLIQRYAIERIPPHTLVVRIEERDAVMALEGDGALQLLDPAGVLIGTAEERPVGVPLAREQAADPASPAFSAAGRVIRDLPPDIREQLAEVSATSAQDVSFILTSGTQVVWGEAAETQRKAIVLRSVLSAVGAVAKIDVSSPNAPVFQ
jgi:cell division septal protein FtsQ